ncbi:PREDICTED: cadherin-17 [Gekko japonicus]|uniref:Cadherin-17 n=1 Tax=Gekko japonicus TaxID=146911 RepID=A0ABM1JV22_GEKJA|nr:PREDICTED: cadherin-17 [Gekko japonicus]
MPEIQSSTTQEEEASENEKTDNQDRNTTGKLVYLSTTSRPDIVTSIGYRKTSAPSKKEWVAIVCQNLSGPLQDSTFSVQEENRPGVQYLYRFTFEPPVASLRLTGEKEGIIDISPKDGILYLNGSLDWETKNVYKLQVEGLDANGVKVKGPYSITINVEDINDNPPQFDQNAYYGVVRQNSRPGKPFMYVTAHDRDDPSTPHAQLTYRIHHHFPNPYPEMLFQIDNVTGAISTTPTGALKLNPQDVDRFILDISVQDMAGQSVNSFKTNVDVNVTVMENLWKAPPPVKITENSTEPHPIIIAQVQWNEPGAKYEILQKEKPAIEIPFTVDRDGNIYVTRPLDREEKAFYSFFVGPKDNDGEWLAYPVAVSVTVQDINDNPPVCDKALAIFEVQENEGVGNDIGILKASDRDEEGSLNSRLKYRIVEQSPQIPSGNMFRIELESGKFQLFSSELNRRVASNYSVKVEVADPAFKTLCNVEIHVIDINDQIPVFEKSDYGSLTLPEDKPVGTILLEIQATDADEPFTGSSQIIYTFTSGDPNNTFLIETDPKTNKGYVKIKKVLDFETSPVHNLIISATNPEPLVAGVQYNSSSLAYLRVNVLDVNEAPVFVNAPYIVDILESAPVGAKVVTPLAFDPERDWIRFTLKNDHRKWLRIDPANGTVYIAASMDREMERTYMVQIVATEETKESRSSTAQVIIHLRDVNDNPPTLPEDFSLFFCHPLQGNENGKMIQVVDPDEHSHYQRFTYALLGGNTMQRDWNLSKVEGKHAYIAPKNRNLEPNIYEIPIEINDNGKPPLAGHVILKVNVCVCGDDGSCFREVIRDARPTVAMAVGILVAVLVVIGIILGIVFFRLKRKKEKEQKANPVTAVNPSELRNLT